MFGLRKALVCATLLFAAIASSSSHTQEHDDAIVDWDQFQALLDTIDSSVLHSVLHSLSPKFQDGVFSKDRSAIEHVHSENPIIASKLVHIAKKRQSSNSTSVASVSPSTPAETSAVIQSSIESSSRAASVSSALSSAIHASTVPAATTIIVAPTAPPSATAVQTSGNAIVFSTIGGGLVTLTSSAVGVSFTPSTSTQLYYTTLPNGQVQTSTAVVVVNAPVTATDATGQAGAAATTGSPGLQNGAAPLQVTAAFMAVAGFAALMMAS